MYAPAINAYVPPAPFNPGNNKFNEGADSLEDILSLPLLVVRTRTLYIDSWYLQQHYLGTRLYWSHRKQH